MDSLLELKPVILAEAKASCGCSFVKVRERFFDVREGRWYERETIGVVPCGDSHQDLARSMSGDSVEEMADRISR